MKSLNEEPMTDEIVILVDESDAMIGLTDKMTAHKEGLLHRAVSALIFNSQGEWLLQKRAHQKYHSAFLWSNACCTHPRLDESPIDAASRRLQEEMGIHSELFPWFTFVYKVKIDSFMFEHEFDHVFYGISDQTPMMNPQEVDDWKWISTRELKQWMAQEPNCFTAWFHIIFNYTEKYLPSLMADPSERSV